MREATYDMKFLPNVDCFPEFCVLLPIYTIFMPPAVFINVAIYRLRRLIYSEVIEFLVLVTAYWILLYQYIA